MVRPLPDPAETRLILEKRRTRPPPRPMPGAGGRLAPIIKALDAKFGTGVSDLHRRWPEIVGPTLAGRTEPVKLQPPRGTAPGVLELRVAGPFALLVQHQAQDIMARLDLILGPGRVGRLRIVQGPVKAALRPAKPARRLRPPLDSHLEAQLSRDLENLKDGPLKQSLLKLGREVLRGS